MLKIYSPSEAQTSILRRDNTLIDPDIPASLQASIHRVFGEALTPDQAVRHILADVRQHGDEALHRWTEKIEGITLDSLIVTPEAIKTAASRLPTDLYQALHQAAQRIRTFHNHQPLPSWTTHTMGGIMGQRVTPLRRVGVYVPGGTAPLPSSLLMAVIPAQVAGVSEIVVATPPSHNGGHIPDVILAAAHIAGIKTIYKLGGAQAIAALTFGTQSVSAVDKIVGAGGIFVTLAKRQVYGLVGIDGLYGPTETVVIADETADPAWIAADLLAQAEHDILATAILLTPSRPLAEAVQIEVGQQLEKLSRSEIIATALTNRGGIILTADIKEAAQLADTFAPEHLCLATADPHTLAATIHNAGGLFIGERSFEVLGDYIAGPSHIMPTNGTARFASPLSAIDFVRITSIIALDDATSTQLSPIAAKIAAAEDLTAHAQAALVRTENR